MRAWLQTFNDHYANALTALTATCALLIAALTAWFVVREYKAKYRPYAIPAIDVVRAASGGCDLKIVPRNVGPHPFYFQLTKIEIQIGDEIHQTPDMKDWMLLGPSGVTSKMPAGHVNDIGIGKIRAGQYRSNRVELRFVLRTRSIEHEFTASTSYAFEIDVLSDPPQALFRTEWAKPA